MKLLKKKPLDLFMIPVIIITRSQEGRTQMTIASATRGIRLRIVHPHSQDADPAGLAGLGLHEGEEVIVLRAAPFGGPLLVEVPRSGVRVALDRRIAHDVAVEPLASFA